MCIQRATNGVRPEVWVAIMALFLVGCKKAASGGQAQLPPTQVVAVDAVLQPVAETLSLVGNVTANEMVEIKSETDGIVEEILFNEGQRVKKGQLLLRLDESKLAAAVAEGESNFKLSLANFERSKQLFAERLISQQEFDQAASIFDVNRATLDLHKRQLKDARLYSSFEGFVGARNVSPGQVIGKNMTLTWLVDLDPVKVEFNVPERFVGQLRPNQSITITVAAYPNRTFTGKVFFVSPFVDPQNRTALVKAEIPNENGDLKPGMFANLDLTLTIRDKAVVIPEPALTQLLDRDEAMIFVVDSSQSAQLRKVKLGVRMAGRVEILSGLAGGEKVIVEGTQKIGPGAKVKLAPPEASIPYLSPGGSPAKP